jgi:hypothetical protein
MVLMECCICGKTACSKVRKKTEDGEIDLYYCKEHLRGRKNDENFFDID